MKDYENKVILQCHAELEWLAPNGEQDDDWDWRLEYEGRKGELIILESTTIHAGQNYAFLFSQAEPISTPVAEHIICKTIELS